MRSSLALTSGILTLIAGLTGPASASSGTTAADLVSCPLGVQNTTYSPGLNLFSPAPQVDVDSTGTLGPCVSSDLGHTAGTYHFTGSGDLNCLGGGSAGTGTITWSNPGTSPSHFTFTSTLALRPNGTTELAPL
jgi:hypothetical protein